MRSVLSKKVMAECKAVVESQANGRDIPGENAQRLQPFNRLFQEATTQESTGIGLVVPPNLL